MPGRVAGRRLQRRMAAQNVTVGRAAGDLRACRDLSRNTRFRLSRVRRRRSRCAPPLCRGKHVRDALTDLDVRRGGPLRRVVLAGPMKRRAVCSHRHADDDVQLPC